MTRGTGCGSFSGSATLTEHVGKPRVYVIYTAVIRDKAHETVRNEGLRESQCLAWSEDPHAMEWTKLREPVIGVKATGRARHHRIRDPSVWKQGNYYFLTVGSGIEKVEMCPILRRSKDLKHWQYLHPLISGTWNGRYTPISGDGEMWECPDFFPLDSSHVLIYSSMGKVFWRSGELIKRL